LAAKESSCLEYCKAEANARDPHSIVKRLPEVLAAMPVMASRARRAECHRPSARAQKCASATTGVQRSRGDPKNSGNKSPALTLGKAESFG
jgi:hypothetical protein